MATTPSNQQNSPDSADSFDTPESKETSPGETAADADHQESESSKLASEESERIKVLLLLDAITLIVLMINLGWLIFDWFYTFDWFNNAFASIWSTGHSWYGEVIHDHFYYYDLYFVAFFVAEILISWVVAIKQHTYPKWYDYPFVHWYDVLGCIPVTGFRFLRLLRVITIVLRIQRLGWVDIRSWWIVQALDRPYRIIMEEISDRVVINVLQGAQTEIRQSNDLEDKIINQVIKPRAALIADELSTRISETTRNTYRQHRDELADYLQHAVHKAVADNKEVTRLARIPLVGDSIRDQLDHAISDILLKSLDSALGQLDQQLVDNMITTALDEWLQSQKNENLTELGDAIAETMELVQQQVAIKRWQKIDNQAKSEDVVATDSEN